MMCSHFSCHLDRIILTNTLHKNKRTFQRSKALAIVLCAHAQCLYHSNVALLIGIGGDTNYLENQIRIFNRWDTGRRYESLWWSKQHTRSGVRFPAWKSHLFAAVFRPALGSTKPPIQLLSGVLSSGLERSGNKAGQLLPRVPISRTRGATCASLSNTSSWRDTLLNTGANSICVLYVPYLCVKPWSNANYYNESKYSSFLKTLI